MKEKEFYEKIKNWDFSHIKMIEEKFTNWDMYDVLRSIANEESVCLDLGTGGGENVLKHYPKVKYVLGTDYSDGMIETALKNLEKHPKDYVHFRTMDNLNMDTPLNYFDIVTARHTVIDAKRIYDSLKKGGHLIIRGVDKMDCFKLKYLFGYGQNYFDPIPISVKDLKDIIDAGFKGVELIPIHVKEYYETKEDLLALLYKTPILREDLNEEIDLELLDKYIEENTTPKGIELIRRYYGIVAEKR